MDYQNKLVLAPMVRVGTLSFRMLAAEYGADITYGEEIIDHKLVKCERRINVAYGTTEFVEKGTDNVVFSTCKEERNRVVFQMGTSDAVRALKAAEIVCNDVATVDINMGCPKAFSIQGGMGAALLSKPELIHDILATLKRNLDVPVTCKIRLLKSPADTVELARRIEKLGVPALAVHGRKIADRPRDPAKWDEIADVVAALSIPVIANGDVLEYDDFSRIKTATGAASVMVARGAMWNASIFSPKGKLHWEDVKKKYLRKSILWNNDVKSTKYTIKEMIAHHSCLELPEGKSINKADTLEDLAMKDEDREARIEQKKKISEIFKDFMTGITQLEELGNAANNFLLRFQQGLSFLQRPPMVTSSKLMENIIKKNETRRLKSYMEAGCINIHDAAQSTRALHTSLSGLSDHLIKAKSLLIELEHLTDEAALAIETATQFSVQLDKYSSDELQQVTCDEENETAQLPQGPEVLEYAALIAVIYNMMKQNYAMQEKIVRSLSLKSSSGELESYSLMWSLRPFVEDEIVNSAWKWIY